MLREDTRHVLAKQVCKLPYSRLFEWGITRASRIDGLDTIGLPVYASCRPPGTVISVSAGKGLTPEDSKAGAILEGVELWAAEHPRLDFPWSFCSSNDVKHAFPNKAYLPQNLFHLAHSAPVHERTLISWDEIDDVFRSSTVIVPSDMVWIVARIQPPFQYFQTSSNGLAAGVSYTDALLQATYEVVERDGWSISEHIRDKLGQWPPVVSLECPLPKSIHTCLDHLSSASVCPFIFDLSTDLNVPIFGCTLLDTSDSCLGVFAGYGCSLDPETALRRAITEAVQARACYIGAARDDLFRRKFVILKNHHSKHLLALYQSLPAYRSFSQYPARVFGNVSEEWDALSMQLKTHGIDELYSKVIYESLDPYFCIVRVVAPEMESPKWEHWTPRQRAEKAVQATLEVARA